MRVLKIALRIILCPIVVTTPIVVGLLHVINFVLTGEFDW